MASMRAPFVALALTLAGCTAASPDPLAMAADLPTARPLDAASAAALGVRVDEALARLEAGDVAAARRIAAEVLAADPSSARARAITAQGLMQDALEESPPTLGPWRRAEGELLRASRLAPNDPVVARLHARFLVADGHLSAAAARIDEGLAAEPDDPELLTLGARVRFDLGDERAAIPLLRRVEALRPDDPDPVWRLAQCQIRLAPAEIEGALRRERFDAAVAAFTRYRRLAPTDPDGFLAEAQARLARALAGDGVDPEEIERVIGLYRDAARLDPTSAEPAFGQGVAHELAGRAEDARSAYRAALALDPGHLPSLLNLGASLADAGDREAAVPLLRRALELGVTPDERDRIERYLAGG
jgi:Flp pilus assembly protein TadD